MPICALVGDCIATRPFGLGGQFSSCVVRAEVGANSSRIGSFVPSSTLRWLVISAGTNDPENPRLVENLRAMRARAHADVVLWILPVAPKAAAAVRTVAREHGDKAVGFVPGAGGKQARVHPKSYSALARSVRGAVEPVSANR